ncbi:hypothetical protein ACFLU5_14695 [Bacteroidota bacterium]
MKDFFLKSGIALVFLFAVMANVQGVETKGAKVAGTWNYSAPDAPYEYSRGQIILTENGDKLEGKVDIDGNEMKLNNIKLEKDLLTCSLYVEGEYVSVKITFKKNKFEGTANTPEGTITLTGERAK